MMDANPAKSYDLNSLKKMTPREFDEAVAEVVMGWFIDETLEDCSRYSPGASWDYGADGYTTTCLVYRLSNGSELDMDFHPCSLATTWEGLGLVVEKMHQRGFILLLDRCGVRFNRPGSDREWGITRGKPTDLPLEVAFSAIIAITNTPGAA